MQIHSFWYGTHFYYPYTEYRVNWEKTKSANQNTLNTNYFASVVVNKLITVFIVFPQNIFFNFEQQNLRSTYFKEYCILLQQQDDILQKYNNICIVHPK